MKLIGAGLPRTATTTQMIALEMLGLPCYHMRDMMMDLEGSVPQWRKAFEGDADWDEIFAGKESTVDWPAAWHYRELMDYYPDAKVLLTVRDAQSWYDSALGSIHEWTMAGRDVGPPEVAELLAAVWDEHFGGWEAFFDRERAIAAYEKAGFRDAGSHRFMLGSDPQTDRLDRTS